MNDYTLYILMRTDLASMTTGRAMAQASHASNAFIHEAPNNRGVSIWKSETVQGFGTAIVLGATMDDILEITKEAKNLQGVYSNKVVDPEYGVKTTKEIYNLIDPKKIWHGRTIINDDGSVIFFKSEITCAYVFGSKALLKPILGHLQLHP